MPIAYDHLHIYTKAYYSKTYRMGRRSAVQTGKIFGVILVSGLDTWPRNGMRQKESREPESTPCIIEQDLLERS